MGRHPKVLGKVDAPKTNNLRDFSTHIGGVILEGDFCFEEK
jgi:hypothetical protein